jgi:hypothetical protein
MIRAIVFNDGAAYGEHVVEGVLLVEVEDYNKVIKLIDYDMYFKNKKNKWDIMTEDKLKELMRINNINYKYITVKNEYSFGD